MKFLIDECLTIDLVGVATQAGFLAELSRLGELINQVIAADLDGDEAILTMGIR